MDGYIETMLPLPARNCAGVDFWLEIGSTRKYHSGGPGHAIRAWVSMGYEFTGMPVRRGKQRMQTLTWTRLDPPAGAFRLQPQKVAFCSPLAPDLQ